jgi:hypothetical protein
MIYLYFNSKAIADKAVNKARELGKSAYRLDCRTMGQWEVRVWG